MDDGHYRYQILFRIPFNGVSVAVGGAPHLQCGGKGSIPLGSTNFNKNKKDITVIASRQVQEFLGQVPDGKWGPKTREAAKDLLESRGVDTDGWNNARLSVGVQQVMMSSFYSGRIDGFMGPVYYKALEEFQNQQVRDSGKSSEVNNTTDNQWPFQKDVYEFYGDVGENQVMLELPYQCKISWSPKILVERFSLHKKVAPSANRVLKAVLKHYGIDEIRRLGLDLWSGSLNVRKMRGGNSYSMHSWGIAIDWDAEHNEMRLDHRKARFAQPEYNKWWELWESEGWTSLGRTRDFDWMHVQAANL